MLWLRGQNRSFQRAGHRESTFPGLYMMTLFNQCDLEQRSPIVPSWQPGLVRVCVCVCVNGRRVHSSIGASDVPSTCPSSGLLHSRVKLHSRERRVLVHKARFA